MCSEDLNILYCRIAYIQHNIIGMFFQNRFFKKLLFVFVFLQHRLRDSGLPNATNLNIRVVGLPSTPIVKTRTVISVFMNQNIQTKVSIVIIFFFLRNPPLCWIKFCSNQIHLNGGYCNLKMKKTHSNR